MDTKSTKPSCKHGLAQTCIPWTAWVVANLISPLLSGGAYAQNRVPVPESAIRADYAVTMHIPGAQETQIFFVEYCVTEDEWGVRVAGIAPHWTWLNCGPYALDLAFVQGKNEASLSRPEGKYQLTAKTETLRSSRFSEGFLGDWFQEGLRNQLWLPRSSRRAGEYLSFGADLVTEQGKVIEGQHEIVTQHSATADFERKNVLKKYGQSWLPRWATFKSGNERFPQWNRSLVEKPSTRTQKMGAWLMPTARGGRRVDLSWSELQNGLWAPNSVRTTLGSSKQGMFLREAKLITANVISQEAAKSQLDEWSSTARGMRPCVSLRIKAYEKIWNRGKPLTLEQRQLANQLSADIQREMGSSSTTLGDRLMLLQLNTYLLIASGADPDQALSSAKEVFELLFEHCPAEAACASLLDLQDTILKFSPKPDLETLWKWAIYDSKITNPAQLRTLTAVQHNHFADDLHCLLLLRTIERSYEPGSQQTLHLREALVQATRKLRLQMVNHGRQTHFPQSADDRFSPIARLNSVTESLSQSDDPKLSSLAMTVQKMVNSKTRGKSE